MALYLLKKKNKNKKIVELNYESNGYIFKPNIRSTNMIQISNLSLFDEKIIKIVLNNKINKSFSRLYSIISSVLNDEDTTSGDIIIALDEVAKEKAVILKKYSDYLEKQEKEELLKQLKLFEKELRNKIIYEIEEEKSFSR